MVCGADVEAILINAGTSTGGGGCAGNTGICCPLVIV